MKKHLFTISLLLSCLAFVSCKKEDNEKCDPDGDCFTAKIDGASFVSDNVTGTEFFGIINIGATFGTTDVPTFGVSLINTAEGTYQFDSKTDVTATYSPAAVTSTVLYGAASGSLTIESHDAAAKRIKGSFNFEGVDANGGTIQVMEGAFDLKYQ